MAEAILSADRLRELLHYDPLTGEFSRLVALRGGRLGPVVSPPFKNGYRYINVDGHRYLSHRIAWLYVHGKLPDNDIDHINCNRADNRFSNLRDVARFVNNQNRRRARADNMSSGLTGVTWHAHSRKWRARITLHGREYRLGLYTSPGDAYDAYIKAKRRLHEGRSI